MSKDNWEVVGAGGGLLDALIPGPIHTIVRDTNSGVAREVYHMRDEKVGEAIANGQFTSRDVSICNK